MNKVIITMVCMIVIISAILTAIFIFKPSREVEKKVDIAKNNEEIILDDCTDEYEYMQGQAVDANASEEKTSPNCSITFKRYYNKCGHTLNEYNNLPESLINKSENEIAKEFNDWKIEKFSNNEIILSTEIDAECGEHYLVKDVDGKLVIYKIAENGEEVLHEQTEISTDYLTDTDKINMKNGIRVNGKEELNQLIEDFE